MIVGTWKSPIGRRRGRHEGTQWWDEKEKNIRSRGRERDKGTGKWTGLHISRCRYQWHIPIIFYCSNMIYGHDTSLRGTRVVQNDAHSRTCAIVVIETRPGIISILQPKPPYMYIKDWYRRIGQMVSSCKEKRVFVTQERLCVLVTGSRAWHTKWDIRNTTDHHDHQTPISPWYMEHVPGLKLVKKTFNSCRKGM